MKTIRRCEIVTNLKDGDKILIKRQNVAENGEIVVAMTEEDCVTVKRYFFKNNQVILHPENDSMEDMIFERITILGKVVGLYRKF